MPKACIRMDSAGLWAESSTRTSPCHRIRLAAKGGVSSLRGRVVGEVNVSRLPFEQLGAEVLIETEVEHHARSK